MPKKIILLLTLFLTCLAVLFISKLKIDDNITSLLPQNQETLHTFSLLQSAPIFQKIYITLHSDSLSPNELIQQANTLAKQLPSSFFSKVILEPPIKNKTKFFLYLLDNLPNLCSLNDLAYLKQKTTPAQIKQSMQKNYELLVSPLSTFIKPIILKDPLHLREILISKLKNLQISPQVKILHNHFISKDKKNILIIAQTPIKITDTHKVKNLVLYLNKLIKKLPQKVKAHIIGAHFYAFYNAERIKKDLKITLGVSILGLILIYFLFLRSWQGIIVLIMPMLVLSWTIALISLFYSQISGFALSFGAVLTGISIDYGLHVYFALTSKQSLKNIFSNIKKPLFFSALTSIGAFLTLLSANLPALRQLALLSILGLCLALAFSLFFLPYFFNLNRPHLTHLSCSSKNINRNKYYFIFWIILVISGTIQFLYIPFNGNLKSLNYIPKELSQQEQYFKKTWGNIREKAIILVNDSSLQKALKLNDLVYFKLIQSTNNLNSLAPILPSIETQYKNYQAWKSFWTPNKYSNIYNQINQIAKNLGFTSNTFDPFFKLVQKKFTPITPSNLKKIAKPIYSSFIFHQNNQYKIFTFIPDTSKLYQISKHILPPEAKIISASKFQHQLAQTIQNELSIFFNLASCFILLILYFYFRNIKKVLLASIPIITGLTSICIGMWLFKLQFSIINIVSIPLVIGLAADYGIFMLSHLQKKLSASTTQAIFVSSLTTLVGFGALAIAKHPAMHSIGITVLFGISGAAISTLFIMPLLYVFIK